MVCVGATNKPPPCKYQLLIAEEMYYYGEIVRHTRLNDLGVIKA